MAADARTQLRDQDRRDIAVKWTLAALGGAFEGVFPATLATRAPDGMPNLVFVSQVHYVDDQHVAVSEQFLKHTLDNLVACPEAQAYVLDPTRPQQFRLDLAFVRRETEGATVAKMRAKLAAIATATGAGDLFSLRAAIVCRVVAIRPVEIHSATASEPPRGEKGVPASCLGDLADALARAEDLESLTDTLLDTLAARLGYDHVALFLLDEVSSSLFAIGSRGFDQSGIGGEVPLGAGLVGQCAATRLAIRVSCLSRERAYARAAQASPRDISPPALADRESFLAVPIVRRERVLGVLAVESAERIAFDGEDEATLKLAAHLASASLSALDTPASPSERVVRVRIYDEDDSVFVDNEYVVKGTAGRLLAVALELVRERDSYDFTNRELRLDPRSRLSAWGDNLEARLLLLRKRLDERSPHLRLVSTGRGRLRLEVAGQFVVERIAQRGRAP